MARLLEIWEVPVFLPLVRRRGRGRDVLQPYLWCYLFAHFDLGANVAPRIRSAAGVDHLVAVDGVPVAIPDALVDELRALVEARRTGNLPAAPADLSLEQPDLPWRLRMLDFNARFLQLVAELNFGLPQYALGRIVDALNANGKPLKGSSVLILGVTTRADGSAVQEATALDLIHLLRDRGVDVVYHDPYVLRLDVEGLAMDATALDCEALQRADCVVIATPHRGYDWGWVAENSRLLVDTRVAHARPASAIEAKER